MMLNPTNLIVTVVVVFVTKLRWLSDFPKMGYIKFEITFFSCWSRSFSVLNKKLYGFSPSWQSIGFTLHRYISRRLILYVPAVTAAFDFFVTAIIIKQANVSASLRMLDGFHSKWNRENVSTGALCRTCTWTVAKWLCYANRRGVCLVGRVCDLSVWKR